MYSGDGRKIRAFPFRPVAEPSSLTDFIERSGCNVVLIEAVKKLYEVSHKPENPIEWLRLYFKYLAEDVASGAAGPGISVDVDADFARDTDEAESMLKAELSEVELEIISCVEEEAQNKAVIDKLENELKRVTLSSAKSQTHEDFLKYIHHGEDYHYRIRPDPSYQPSKTDLLLEKEDIDNRSGLGIHGQGGGGGFGGGAPLKKEDSMVELVPFDPNLWADGFHRQSGHAHLHQTGEETTIYDDYPLLYFPERQKEEVGEGVEEEEMDDDSMDEEEEEEEGDEEEEEGDYSASPLEGRGDDVKDNRSMKSKASKDKRGRGGRGLDSEYDGGSEGGEETDQSRDRIKQSQYTPRNAHDNRKLKENSQIGQLKTTNDKNV